MHDYIAQLADDTALWSAGLASSEEIVVHACDALVSGVDSQALRELAGASSTAPADDLEDLLRRVAADFGYAFYWRHSEDGRAAAARVMAKRCLQGRLTPRELASWMHDRIGHGHHDMRVETLVMLDDEYDYPGGPREDVDRAVLAAARALLELD